MAEESSKYQKAIAAFNAAFDEFLRSHPIPEEERSQWRLITTTPTTNGVKNQQIVFGKKDCPVSVSFSTAMPQLEGMELFDFKNEINHLIESQGFIGNKPTLPRGTYEKLIEGDTDALALFAKWLKPRVLKTKGGKQAIEAVGSERIADDVVLEITSKISEEETDFTKLSAVFNRFIRTALRDVIQRHLDTNRPTDNRPTEIFTNMGDAFWRNSTQTQESYYALVDEFSALLEDPALLQRTTPRRMEILKKKLANPDIYNKQIGEGFSVQSTNSNIRQILIEAYSDIITFLTKTSASDTYPNLAAMAALTLEAKDRSPKK